MSSSSRRRLAGRASRCYHSPVPTRSVDSNKHRSPIDCWQRRSGPCHGNRRGCSAASLGGTWPPCAGGAQRRPPLTARALERPRVGGDASLGRRDGKSRQPTLRPKGLRGEGFDLGRDNLLCLTHILSHQRVCRFGHTSMSSTTAPMHPVTADLAGPEVVRGRVIGVEDLG